MKPQAQALLMEADAYFERNRIEDAIGTIRRGLAVEPDEVRFYTLLTRCYVKLGKGRDAMTAARKSIELAPDWSQSHIVLALALWSDRKPNDALKSLIASLRQFPKDPGIFDVMSRLYAAKGMWKECLGATEDGLALKPDSQALAETRGKALSRLGRTQEAQEILSRVVVNDPNKGSALAELGWNELRMGKFQAAARLFQDALRANPNDAMARTGLLECLRTAVPPYRAVAKFNDKMRGLGPGLTFLPFLVFSLMRVAVASTKELNPAIFPVVATCVIVPVVFFALLKPVSQCFVFFHPLGHDALYPAERALVGWFMVWLFVSLIELVLILLLPQKPLFALLWPGFLGLIVFVGLSFTRDTSKSAFWLAHVIGGALSVFALGYLVVGLKP